MSRHTAHGPRYSLAYGVDHDPLIGAFVQVWDKTIDTEPDCENVVVDLDGLSGTVVTPEMVVELATRYDVALNRNDVHADMAQRPAPIQRDPRLQRVIDRVQVLMAKQHGDNVG